MKQRGSTRLNGTIDDITFYNYNGKDYARKKTEISEERWKKDPAFSKQRNNSSEFSLATKIAGRIRKASLAELKGYNDQEGNEQLTRILRKIITFGNGRRGKRSFELLNVKHFLQNYSFNNAVRLDDLFFAPLTIQCSPDRNEATLTIPDFQNGLAVFPPPHATHFRLTFCIGTVSNYTFNQDQGYLPLNPNENALHARARSAIISINNTSSPGFNLTVQLPGLPTIPPTTSLITTLGIDFIEEVNGDYSFSPFKRTMKILEIF